MSWHVPESTLRAYVDATVPDTDAWSVEAHVVECETCRRRIAAVAEGTETAAAVARSWSVVAAALPRQGSVRRYGRFRAVVSMASSGPAARRAWLAATLFVLLVSLVLDVLGTRVGAAGAGAGVPWLTLLAPLIPVIGVAAAYDSGLDDSGEIIASTPSSGLRLLLSRTLAVLLVTVPAVLVVDLAVSRPSPAGWLLPALALTASTLALGSVVDMAPAAAVVGLTWFGVAGGSAMASETAPLFLRADATPLWLALAALAVIVVALRSGSFSRPPVRSLSGRNEARS